MILFLLTPSLAVSVFIYLAYRGNKDAVTMAVVVGIVWPFVLFDKIRNPYP
jgi:hypothetical protein